jgi:hypothetical protein
MAVQSGGVFAAELVRTENISRKAIQQLIKKKLIIARKKPTLNNIFSVTKVA